MSRAASELAHLFRALKAPAARGAFVALDVDNPHVLAFLRVIEEGTVPGEPAATVRPATSAEASDTSAPV